VAGGLQRAGRKPWKWQVPDNAKLGVMGLLGDFVMETNLLCLEGLQM
jgi:hypothetical protein